MDAFILFNQAEKEKVLYIVNYLDSQRVTSYFPNRDTPVGVDWREFASAQLRSSRTIVIFLGDSGWSETQERFAREAVDLQMPITPVLIGNPSTSELDKVNGLFRDRQYFEMLSSTKELLTALVKIILRHRNLKSPPAYSGHEISQKIEESEEETAGTESVKSENTDTGLPVRPDDPIDPFDPPVFPADTTLDVLIGELTDTHKETRLDALARVKRLSPEKAALLAVRLRDRVQGQFSLEAQKTSEAANRNQFPVIRSWMLSALIWCDGESVESQKCLMAHLDPKKEPGETVRFWILADLFRKEVSYVKAAADFTYANSAPHGSVQVLAGVILGHKEPYEIEELRRQLSADDYDHVLALLRALRIVPIPALAKSLCGMVTVSRNGKPLAYDVLHALAHKDVAREAAGTLLTRPGVDRLVGVMVETIMSSSSRTYASFVLILAELPQARVHAALEEAGRNDRLRETSETLRERLRRYMTGNSLGLDELEKTFVASIARFNPDNVPIGHGPEEKVVDALNVGEYAGHLAQLIAAKTTPMPLSIGLFGAWGSGKSHFIRLTCQKIDALSQRGGEAFHKNIVHIHFNAWHYLDTSLWANLVCEIFDQLFARLVEKKDVTEEQLKALHKEAAELDSLRLAHEKELEGARASETRAKEKAQQAKADCKRKEKSFKGMAETVSALVAGDEGLRSEVQQVAKDMDVLAADLAFTDLEKKIEETKKIGGHARLFVHEVAQWPGTRWLVLLFPLVFWILPLLVQQVHLIGPTVSDLLRNDFVQIIAGLTAIITAVSKGNAATGDVLLRLNDAFVKIKKAREKVVKSGDYRNAEEAFKKAEETAKQREKELNDIQAKIKAVAEQIEELSPQRQLVQHVSGRTGDYRKHLGLVSTIHKDFQRLSDLLLNASQSGNQKLPQIDRIVLYIDDLDRCRPKRVVEVLEAVHLLLAFRLFTVVVAVDPRWLSQSLLEHYADLLGKSTDPAAKQNAATLSSGPATPQDYLEKIFQVPFNLQRVSQNGFVQMLDHLFGVKQGAPPAPGPKVESGAGAGPETELGSETRSGTGTASNTGTGLEPGMESKPETESESGIEPGPETGPGNPSDQQAQPVDPERFVLSREELAALGKLQPLFRTPRAVTRFANTYSLIRVGITKSEWGSFMVGDYHTPMLLLAVAAAQPSLASAWLDVLDNLSDAHVTPSGALVDKLHPASSNDDLQFEWDKLAEALDEIKDHWPVLDKKSLETWIPRVARYSF